MQRSIAELQIPPPTRLFLAAIHISLLRFVEIKQRRQDLGAPEMRGKLHRPDLAVEEQLVGRAHRSSVGVALARQPRREVEFEGGIRRRSGGGGLRVHRSAGNETSGGKHEVHGTSGSTVVKSTVRLAAAWARGGAHIRSGTTVVDTFAVLHHPFSTESKITVVDFYLSRRFTTKHQNLSKLFVISNISAGRDEYGLSEKVFFIGLDNTRVLVDVVVAVPIDVPVDDEVDGPVDVAVDGPVDVAVDDPVNVVVDGLVDVVVEGLVDDADYGPVDVPVTIHEQEIMTQEDLDFFNEFDFSTPFENQPLPFQDQHVPQENQLVPPYEELVPPCDQLPVLPSDVLPDPPTNQGILQTKHGVSICHGQPPKSKQCQSKSKENHHPTNDKGKKPKLRKRYMTRTATTFKSVFFGNKDDPLTID
nr:Cell division protein FtsH [Ipomoea batatas]